MSEMKRPQGYHQQTDDVLGYWDSDSGPIHCVPRSAKMFDGNIDAARVSILVLAELVEDCPNIRAKKVKGEEEGEKLDGKKGDVIGIWVKPGMKAIRDLCGQKVWMEQNPKDQWKDIGKPSKMVTYTVLSPSKGTRIPVVEDTREESASVTTFLDAPKRGKGDEPGEEIPF